MEKQYTRQIINKNKTDLNDDLTLHYIVYNNTHSIYLHAFDRNFECDDIYPELHRFKQPEPIYYKLCYYEEYYFMIAFEYKQSNTIRYYRLYANS